MRGNHFRFLVQAGFTVVELIIVVVVLGIISAYAIMKTVSPGVATLPSQAQTMANDIRHAQSLAYTGGKSLRLLLVGSNQYAVYSCVANTAGTILCNTTSTDPIMDPATGQQFIGTLQKGVTLSVLSGTSPLDFNSLGQPSANVAYCLKIPGNSGSTCDEAVSVAALTGYVAVSP